jgi:phospholipid/cholesterol/gamma-HCH transport system ATP-binding protein
MESTDESARIVTMPDRERVVEVEGLTVRYGNNTILEGVSLEVYKGEVLVILGGSGSGKSVLLKHMIGLDMPSAGRVAINGIDITREEEEGMRKLRKGIGMLFQSSALFGSMTLSENVALPLEEFTHLSEGTIDLVVKMKLGMVGLAGYENHFPAEISGGMKKRAGIARAMALDPQILFFDEPSAGLDPVTSAELDLLIQGINVGMGTTMVIVTHELESIFAIAHRVVMLDKSKKGIIATGTPWELKKHSSEPRVRNFFNRKAMEHQAKGT